MRLRIWSVVGLDGEQARRSLISNQKAKLTVLSDEERESSKIKMIVNQQRSRSRNER